jgi:predicted nucleotide-binding protein
MWVSKIKIYFEKYLRNHTLYDETMDILNKKNHWLLHFHDQLIANLKAIYEDEDYWNKALNNNQKLENNNKSKDIFIVHGHDEFAIKKVENFIRKIGYNPIILHNQPNKGNTIIEKIEEYTNVCYAIVLYTQCDKGREKNKNVDNERYRARQNVVFEHGYLVAKLGRKYVAALVQNEVETPGDISGVVYISMTEGDSWEYEICKELKALELDVDLNKIL